MLVGICRKSESVFIYLSAVVPSMVAVSRLGRLSALVIFDSFGVVNGISENGIITVLGIFC